MVEHAPGVVGSSVLINGRTAVFFRQEFLNFPAIRLDSDRKLEILLGDRVPELQP